MKRAPQLGKQGGRLWSQLRTQGASRKFEFELWGRVNALKLGRFVLRGLCCQFELLWKLICCNKGSLVMLLVLWYLIWVRIKICIKIWIWINILIWAKIWIWAKVEVEPTYEVHCSVLCIWSNIWNPIFEGDQSEWEMEKCARNELET